MMPVPTLYLFKPAFKRLLQPVCDRLARHGISPNQVTVSAVVLSLAQGFWLMLEPGTRTALLVLPFVLFVRMALNAIDGMLADKQGMRTPLGCILNELGDVTADAFLYLPFSLIPGINPVQVVLLVVSGIIVEMTGVTAAVIGAHRRNDGPLGKCDRAMLFGSIAVLLGLGIAPGLWLDVLLVSGLLLSAYTIYNRARCGVGETV